MSALVPQRTAVAAAATGLGVLVLVRDVDVLLTGGAIVLLLAVSVVVMAARPRARGWVIAAGILAGEALFVLAWAPFVVAQERAAGADASVWGWAAVALALICLGASAWLLAVQPRGRFAFDRDRINGLAGLLVLLAGLGAGSVAVAVAVGAGSPGLAAALLVAAAVLLRTFRPAEPSRHLADVVVATALLACLAWWVFVGTVLGSGSIGMLAVVSVVFLASLTRAGHAADAVALSGQPKRPEM
jgi:hypothetical protein